MRLEEEYLEINTRVGCPVGCLRYCPQDVIKNNYSDKQTALTMENFKLALEHVPSKLPVVFSGFCEPFANEETPNFIRYAYENQHPIGLFTTLVGLSKTGLSELLKIKYFVFCLHLPDGQNMKMPLSPEYKDNVFTVLQNIPNVSFNIMNDTFKTDDRENFTRGVYSPKPSWLKYCRKWSHPSFVMMPDGDVQLCCHDFGLQHKLGNLFNQSYSDIRRAYHPGYKLCGVCPHLHSLPKYIAIRKGLEFIQSGQKP